MCDPATGPRPGRRRVQPTPRAQGPPLDRTTTGHDPRGDAQWPAARPPRAGCGELARRAHGERLTIFMLERAGGAGHRRRPADE